MRNSWASCGVVGRDPERCARETERCVKGGVLCMVKGD